MGAYDDARALLPPAALKRADELIACAPPLTPGQWRTLQRLLGPYVPDPRVKQAQAARTAA
jgi:hypothetical protein